MSQNTPKTNFYFIKERMKKKMIKFYCDRCGKESKKLHEIKIPTQKRKYNNFDTKIYQVCADCENEYDNIIGKLVDIRFVLFDGFMRKDEKLK